MALGQTTNAVPHDYMAMPASHAATGGDSSTVPHDYMPTLSSPPNSAPQVASHRPCLVTHTIHVKQDLILCRHQNFSQQPQLVHIMVLLCSQNTVTMTENSPGPRFLMIFCDFSVFFRTLNAHISRSTTNCAMIPAPSGSYKSQLSDEYKHAV